MNEWVSEYNKSQISFAKICDWWQLEPLSLDFILCNWAGWDWLSCVKYLLSVTNKIINLRDSEQSSVGSVRPPGPVGARSAE